MFLQYVSYILFEIILFLLYIGVVNASSSIDNIVTCPKKRKRETRDLYAQKNVARKLQITPQEKEVKQKESKKNYNRMVREHRANNLYPDSIAMESPHFNPLLISPSSP
jgi:hypothetical protein